MKLFDDLKKCKHLRKDYKIKPTIRFYIDRRRYRFSFVPTIVCMPWIYLYPNCDGVIDIWWLHFHILIGKLEVIKTKTFMESINDDELNL